MFCMVARYESKVKNCEQCQLHRHMPAKAPIHPWEWPRVHMDHTGPYLGKLFLILIDAHSKWIEAHIVSSTAADVTIAKLCSMFTIHGIPEHLVSDNRSGFFPVRNLRFSPKKMESITRSLPPITQHQMD